MKPNLDFDNESPKIIVQYSTWIYDPCGKIYKSHINVQRFIENVPNFKFLYEAYLKSNDRRWLINSGLYRSVMRNLRSYLSQRGYYTFTGDSPDDLWSPPFRSVPTKDWLSVAQTQIDSDNDTLF